MAPEHVFRGEGDPLWLRRQAPPEKGGIAPMASVCSARQWTRSREIDEGDEREISVTTREASAVAVSVSGVGEEGDAVAGAGLGDEEVEEWVHVAEGEP